MAILLTVELKDGAIYQMTPEAFEHLLKQRKIVKLKRKEGWAVIGQDCFRGSGKAFVYCVPERRRS